MVKVVRKFSIAKPIVDSRKQARTVIIHYPIVSTFDAPQDNILFHIVYLSQNGTVLRQMIQQFV